MICPQMSGVDLDGELVKVPCMKHDCPKYVNMQGEHPQSGEILNDWRCADAWVPVLLVESSRNTRYVCASVDKLSNNVKQASAESLHVSAQLLQQVSAGTGEARLINLESTNKIVIE